MPSKLFTRTKNGANKTIAPSPDKKSDEIVLTIDFPQENEKVLLGHYAVRLTARTGGSVEISLNKSDWKPCRPGLGYHWFDWWPEAAGAYKLEARIKVAGGQFKKSVVRSCTVIKPKKA